MANGKIVGAVLVLLLAPASRSIPKSEFFDMSGTPLQKMDDGFAGPIQLTTPFKFFNDVHTHLFVSNNGVVSFEQGVSSFTADCGAMNSNNKIVAPFWADVDTRRGGEVTYRESSDLFELEKVNRQLHSAFPAYPAVRMNWLFSATWNDVPFFYSGVTDNSNVGTCANDDARNTYQVTLTTDGTHSFAIFYYDTLKWTTGTASSGNCSGLAGANGHPAKAGFDVGDRVTFIPITGSCTEAVLNVAHDSNVHQPGVWIWRVDGSLESPPEEIPEPTTEIPEWETGTPDWTETPEWETTEPEIEPVTSAPEIEVPEQRECPALQPTTPCRQTIINVVEHVANFIRDFPTLCLGLNNCALLGGTVSPAPVAVGK